MKRTRTKRLLCILCCSALVDVSSASAMEIIPPYTTTPVSGFPGSPSESFELLGFDGDAIDRIDWYESSNRPCKIVNWSRDPDRDGSQHLDLEHDLCTGEPLNVRRLYFTDNPRWFVRGIATCSNDKTNHRMKGIAIAAAKLPKPNGDIEPLPDFVQATHANCADWNEWVICPADHVAHGLDVRVLDGAIVGLGLICGRREGPEA